MLPTGPTQCCLWLLAALAAWGTWAGSSLGVGHAGVGCWQWWPWGFASGGLPSPGQSVPGEPGVCWVAQCRGSHLVGLQALSLLRRLGPRLCCGLQLPPPGHNLPWPSSACLGRGGCLGPYLLHGWAPMVGRGTQGVACGSRSHWGQIWASI